MAEFASMWVDPSVRRRGIATRLIEDAIAWSRRQGASWIGLWVTQTNDAALRLYRSAGFRLTGRSQPLPSHLWLSELEMARRLG